MRWPCFLLLASLPLASAATAQTTGSASSPKSLTFDAAQVPATRDSFVFRLRGQERGWAVWQYEIRPLEMTQEVVYTAASRSEEHTSELQSRGHLVCRLLLEKKKKNKKKKEKLKTI